MKIPLGLVRWELIFWFAALFSLALSDPDAQGHLVLCPLKLAGFTWCPGCGLGHAISFLLHCRLDASLSSHLLGVPALLIICHRIYCLISQQFFNFTYK